MGTLCGELCKNGWTDRHAVWLWNQLNPRKHVLDGPRSSIYEGTIIRGKDMPVDARRRSAVSCTKMTQPIDLPFGLWTRVGRRKHKFNRIHQVAPLCPPTRAHWRNLANTIEPSVCGGHAALYQSTLTTCYYYYLLCSKYVTTTTGLIGPNERKTKTLRLH